MGGSNLWLLGESVGRSLVRLELVGMAIVVAF